MGLGGDGTGRCRDVVDQALTVWADPKLYTAAEAEPGPVGLFDLVDQFDAEANDAFVPPCGWLRGTIRDSPSRNPSAVSGRGRDRG